MQYQNHNIDRESTIDEIPDDSHMLHMWEPLHFKIKKNYKYINKNPVFLFFSTLLYIIIFPILIVFNKLFYGFKIYGKKNLNGIKGGKITISNHVHPMDCTMIGLANFPHKTYFLSLMSNFNIPVINGIIRLLNAIPIPEDLENKKNFFASINNLLKSGKTLQIYPEGSLWPYYTELREFKSGAFNFAVENNVPIIPMVFKFVKPRGLFKYLKRKPCIHLYILKPVYPDLTLPHEESYLKLKEEIHFIMKEELKN